MNDVLVRGGDGARPEPRDECDVTLLLSLVTVSVGSVGGGDPVTSGGGDVDVEGGIPLVTVVVVLLRFRADNCRLTVTDPARWKLTR
jgi:hypothetical protein